MNKIFMVTSIIISFLSQEFCPNIKEFNMDHSHFKTYQPSNLAQHKYCKHKKK